ncbi:phage portal protein [Lactobacillus crispatus]|jgi:phage portal protein, HK97 family|uniref:phage portal protein n=3 Tax=Lactobacillus crispatus TaxID=47770 RepID=UPI000280B624|nr:phage portal protein [Lactobacillus crispatus]DAR79675.1 MAG TPA: portal protein [Caudoviricetes sp.]EKB65360.1 HK97 family phage portal protein [Lactobacillus crispatus FB049-03]MBH9538934.1 phage portal protein [Lactobacillus crispatus]MBI1701903.1 portal protein [Lactobacillus crispatus]MCT7760600.1 phage portal protein [Lactobacillus crispatus]
MPVFNLNKSNVSGYSLNDPEFLTLFKNDLSVSEYVSADTALKNSDIFSLISQLSADLVLVKMKADKDRTQSLIDNPSNLTNGFAFWQGMFAQLLLDGNAYAYRWRNINGVDLYWEFLRPSQVQVMLLEDGSGLTYNINFDEPDIQTKENVPQSDVIHIRLVSKNGGKTGVSPLTGLANELNIKDASNRLTLHALSQSVEAPGILSVTGGGLLDWKKKSARSREFMRQVNNSDNGPIVLDDLETYQPLEVKSDVAKLLQQADWTGKQIAKVYGVPDSYINGQGDQQSNITQIGGQYAKAINRYAGAVQSELSNKLNSQITYDVRPAIDATGDNFASEIGDLSSKGILSGNQGRYVLQHYGYLPDDLPTPDKPIIPVNEGGEDDDNSTSQGDNRA